MLDTLKLEKISISQELTKKVCQNPQFLHIVQLVAAEKNMESNENQNDERDNQMFSSKAASKSILRFITKNEILGLEADSLEVIPGQCQSTDENDLSKVFFKVTNNPRDNQLDFNYYLGPWSECSIRFSFLSEKIIDISTIEKMNVQDWILIDCHDIKIF